LKPTSKRFRGGEKRTNFRQDRKARKGRRKPSNHEAIDGEYPRVRGGKGRAAIVTKKNRKRVGIDQRENCGKKKESRQRRERGDRRQSRCVTNSGGVQKNRSRK